MALHFPILINDRQVGYVNIQRLEPLADDRPALYQVVVEYPVGVQRKTQLRHDYDRGAVVLIAAAAAAVAEAEPYIATDIDRL